MRKMEEKNKNSLKKAIDGLPKYSPKDSLWDDLSNKMNIQEGEKALHDAINKLPTHKAPDQIWNNIEVQLPRTSRRIWLRTFLAAASIAVLVALFSINAGPSFGPAVVKVSNSELPVLKAELVNLDQFNNAQRDSAFKTIVRAQKKSSDMAKAILAEIELLDKSKERLQSRLSKFEANPDLQNKLNRVKNESIELQKEYLANI